MRARGLVPFLDIAYQGFGDGIDADGSVVRALRRHARARCSSSSSFSKSFSLYGERVGALSVVAADKDEAARVLSQVKRVVRANYSNPPTHGGQIVATVLSSPELRALWEAELGGDARAHQADARGAGREACTSARRAADFGFMLEQRGMFSYSGLTKAQVAAAARGVTRSTRSIPGASASRRSTRATSTTSPTRSPRCQSTRACADRRRVLTVEGRCAIIQGFLRGNSSVGRAQPCQG